MQAYERLGSGRKAPLSGLPKHLPGVSASLHPPSRHPPGVRDPIWQGQGVSQPFSASNPLLQVSSLRQAAPGARQSSIYCLVSTVTRRRRQRLPSAAPTRRRDVCPPFPLCPYLEGLCGQGGAGAGLPRRPAPGPAPPPRGPAALCFAHPSSSPDPAEAGGGTGRLRPCGSASGGCSQSVGSGSSVPGG